LRATDFPAFLVPIHPPGSPSPADGVQHLRVHSGELGRGVKIFHQLAPGDRV